MPRKSPKAAEPAVFNLDDYRVAAYDDPDEREVELRDGRTLHVTLAHLTTRQAKKIPTRGPLEGSYKAAAPHVLAWDLTVTHRESGEEIALPAPGDPAATEMVGEGREWELLEMLDDAAGSQIVMWLTNPGGMQLATERGKTSSRPSRNGATPTDDAAAATT